MPQLVEHRRAAPRTAPRAAVSGYGGALLNGELRQIVERHAELGVDLLVYQKPEGRIRIDWIQNSSGVRGRGRAAVEDIAALAEENDAEIELSVLNGEPRLVEFYEELGFELENAGGPGEDPTYCRRAGAPALSFSP